MLTFEELTHVLNRVCKRCHNIRIDLETSYPELQFKDCEDNFFIIRLVKNTVVIKMNSYNQYLTVENLTSNDIHELKQIFISIDNYIINRIETKFKSI